jgi:hypothetical protein
MNNGRSTADRHKALAGKGVRAARRSASDRGGMCATTMQSRWHRKAVHYVSSHAAQI